MRDYEIDEAEFLGRALHGIYTNTCVKHGIPANKVKWEDLPDQYQNMMLEVATKFDFILHWRWTEEMYESLWLARPNVLGMLAYEEEYGRRAYDKPVASIQNILEQMRKKGSLIDKMKAVKDYRSEIMGQKRKSRHGR